MNFSVNPVAFNILDGFLSECSTVRKSDHMDHPATRSLAWRINEFTCVNNWAYL